MPHILPGDVVEELLSDMKAFIHDIATNPQEAFDETGAAMELLFIQQHRQLMAEWYREREPNCKLSVEPEPQQAKVAVCMKYLKANFGDRFNELYEHFRMQYNAIARRNLDLTKGKNHSFVLPVFYDDGTHDKLGTWDFPWGCDLEV